MSNDKTNASIFVSIASFRDKFLPFTIKSALEKAAHPERLTFGICWQADETENLDEWINDPRFRIRRYHYETSLGYGWSRAEIQKLYADEEYHLLIDSHTWFADGWDDNLIDQLESKPSKKPLLTTSSPPFTFGEDGEVVIPWAGTEWDGVPLMTSKVVPPAWIDIQMSPERKSEQHQQTAIICCNFAFTHGRWIREVPEDPGMINATHEAPLSARSYTHGYDLFLPDELQIWHLDYNNYPNGVRHKVWDVKTDNWQDEHTQNMIRRLQAMLFGKGDPAMLGRYQLGTERSLDQWAELAGLKLEI